MNQIKNLSFVNPKSVGVIKDKAEDVDIYVLGCPRSGTQWTTYIVKQLIDKKVSHTHSILPEVFADYNNYIKLGSPKLIYIQRGYRENIVRCKINKEQMFCWKDEGGWIKTGYWYPLYIYDVWPGEKLYIKYENLILNHKYEIEKIGNFLKVSSKEFLSRYKFHQIKCMDEVDGKHFKSETRSRIKDITFHSNKISEEEKYQIDKIVMETTGVLFTKYLKESYYADL